MNNPLAIRSTGSLTTGGGGYIDNLRPHCDRLNAMAWVAASGLPYFVNERTNAKGQIEHFVDRRITRPDGRRSERASWTGGSDWQ